MIKSMRNFIVLTISTLHCSFYMHKKISRLYDVNWNFIPLLVSFTSTFKNKLLVIKYLLKFESYCVTYTLEIKKKHRMISQKLLLQKSYLFTTVPFKSNFQKLKITQRNEEKIKKKNSKFINRSENEVSAQTRMVRRPTHTSRTQRSLAVQFVWLTSSVRLQRLKDCNDAIASNGAWKFKLYLLLWMLRRFYMDDGTRNVDFWGSLRGKQSRQGLKKVTECYR